MTIRENRELPESELETVTGGLLSDLVQTAVSAVQDVLNGPDGNGSFLGGKSGVSSLMNLNLNKPNPA
jgi:hypothetical protein